MGVDEAWTVMREEGEEKADMFSVEVGCCEVDGRRATGDGEGQRDQSENGEWGRRKRVSAAL